MLWINGKMTDLTKKDAIHKLVDAKCFLERYSNPHDKWTEAINIGIEAIEIVMAQEEQEPTTKDDLGIDREQLKTMIRGLTKWYVKRDNTEVGEPNTAVGLLYDDVMFGIDRLPSVTPQEPLKPMVEIDLYSVIKQKY